MICIEGRGGRGQHVKSGYICKAELRLRCCQLSLRGFNSQVDKHALTLRGRPAGRQDLHLGGGGSMSSQEKHVRQSSACATASSASGALTVRSTSMPWRCAALRRAAKICGGCVCVGGGGNMSSQRGRRRQSGLKTALRRAARNCIGGGEQGATCQVWKPM
jgi:hypothetical protein